MRAAGSGRSETDAMTLQVFFFCQEFFFFLATVRALEAMAIAPEHTTTNTYYYGPRTYYYEYLFFLLNLHST